MLYEVKEEHKHIVENLLEILSVAEDKIVASSNIVLTECGDCLTGFYNADVNEMMIMKGYLELAIIQKSKSYGEPELIESNQETPSEEDE